MTRARSPLTFFILVFALAIPFWVVGALYDGRLLPGLPLSALMVVCPLAAAAIMVYRENDGAGVIALLRRALDYDRITSRLWYVPIFLLMPAIMVASYAVMIALGRPVPAPEIALLPTLVMFAAFFLTGVCEELGWSGYAIDPLQERWGALNAALIIGVIWAAWHFIPLVQAGRAPVWIAWWTLGTLALRVLTVWIYNNSGRSVFAASLFHAVCNVSWQLFPIAGSAYDPRVMAPLEALAAALVVAIWGARTLSRARRAQNN